MTTPFQKIVVATDGSACSDAAVQLGARLALQFDAQLTLIYVFEPVKYALPEGFVPYTPDQLTEMTTHFQQMLAANRDRVQSLGVSRVETRLLQGTAVEEICDFAKNNHADLIVVGTHGRGFVERVLLGSVAERVVRAATVPVLIARATA